MPRDVSNSDLDTCKSMFLSRNHLPESYWEVAQQWFIPIVEDIRSHQKLACKPLLIGINGAQGSGKSTLTDLFVSYLTQVLNINAVGFSIDDFYFTKAERQELAEQIHPLLQTRGVPGTHDIDLLMSTVNSLLNSEPTKIPKFNKAIDDRFAEADWINVSAPVQVIIFEGWCVGSRPVPTIELDQPINQLEQRYDGDGKWRHYINQQLSNQYMAVFDLLDVLIMLRAPSFNCVLSWRIEQEHKMLSALRCQGIDTSTMGMDDDEIETFISYYQRITEDNIARMPSFCEYLVNLDKNRGIISCQKN